MSVRTSRPLPPKAAMVRWESGANTEKFSVQEILAGDSAGFMLVEDDFAILESALKYNYVTARQMSLLLTGDSASRDVQRRLTILLDHGLLSRAWSAYRTTPMPVTLEDGELGTRQKNVKEYIFALSQKGFDLLAAVDHQLAVEWEGHWQSRALVPSRKNSLAHELGRNEVCLAMIRATKAFGRPIVDWRGPREAYHRFVPSAPGSSALLSEPDSILLLDNGRPLFIEYERSGRIARFHKKMMDTRNYMVAGGWKQRFGLQPWVVYAVPEGTGTQERESGSYGGLLRQAVMGSAMRYLLLDQASWESGTWDAVKADGTMTSLWKVVLGD